MNKITEKQFMTAMTKTLRAYEKVIEEGWWDKEDWKNYGFRYYCRICLIFSSCYGCPLASCVEDSYKLLQTIIRLNKDYNNIEPFKARYEWLIKKIEEDGYEYR
jgi:hypothetical protein